MTVSKTVRGSSSLSTGAKYIINYKGVEIDPFVKQKEKTYERCN